MNQMSESINVAKLHVISGTADDDFDKYSLSGTIDGGWDGFNLMQKHLYLLVLVCNPDI